MSILVSVPVEERNVFGGDLDVASAHLCQAACEQTAEAEATEHLLLVFGAEAVLGGVVAAARLIIGRVLADVFARFEREIEGLGGWRAEQPLGAVQRAQKRVSLETAPVLP